jgi:hypothetical protein
MPHTQPSPLLSRPRALQWPDQKESLTRRSCTDLSIPRMLPWTSAERSASSLRYTGRRGWRAGTRVWERRSPRLFSARVSYHMSQIVTPLISCRYPLCLEGSVRGTCCAHPRVPLPLEIASITYLSVSLRPEVLYAILEDVSASAYPKGRSGGGWHPFYLLPAILRASFVEQAALETVTLSLSCRSWPSTLTHITHRLTSTISHC